MSKTTFTQNHSFGFDSLQPSRYLGQDVLKVAEPLIGKSLESDVFKNFKDELIHFIRSHPAIERPSRLLDYYFKDDSLLLESLTHTSFLNEVKASDLRSYERLEFLGDSVLGVLVSTHLMNTFLNLSEGELSRFRSSLVNGKSFAELSAFLGLGECLIMGKGELMSGGHHKENILSDVFESVLGAIYRDGGFEAVNQSFYSLLDAYKKESGGEFIKLERLKSFDSKTRLQEMTMAKLKVLPEYESRQLEDQSFIVELYIAGKKIAEEGNISKKKAQNLLAKKVLEDPNFIKKIEEMAKSIGKDGR